MCIFCASDEIRTEMILVIILDVKAEWEMLINSWCNDTHTTTDKRLCGLPNFQVVNLNVVYKRHHSTRGTLGILTAMVPAGALIRTSQFLAAGTPKQLKTGFHWGSANIRIPTCSKMRISN